MGVDGPTTRSGGEEVNRRAPLRIPDISAPSTISTLNHTHSSGRNPAYAMGCRASDADGCAKERPQHAVQLGVQRVPQQRQGRGSQAVRRCCPPQGALHPPPPSAPSPIAWSPLLSFSRRRHAAQRCRPPSACCSPLLNPCRRLNRCATFGGAGNHARGDHSVAQLFTAV